MTQSLSATTDNLVAAGPFGSWLTQARAALRGDGGMDVPCGDCVGCCTSGYSVQLRPQDSRALAEVPAEFLVSAAGFPAGHMTMPALADGSCPMLAAGKCTIYRERPQTCLDYDCRIFAAAGVAAGGDDKVVINRRVRSWRFTYPTAADKLAHDAVQSAATFIQERRASFTIRVPTAPMGIAVLAIKVYKIFLEPDTRTRSDREIAQAIVTAAREFDQSAP